MGAADLAGAAFGHVDQIGDESAADLLRIDEMGHSEAFAPRLAIRIDVDADDHVGAGKPQPLDDIEADAAETEHDAIGSGLDLGGSADRPDAGGAPSTDLANPVHTA